MDEELKEKLKEKHIALIPKKVLQARGDIGAGAFGSVCKAYHTVWKKEVAVKIMNIVDRLTEKDEKKLLNEAETMLHIRHEHVLYIYGVCLDHTGTVPVYGIVMHYMENGSVKSFFQYLEDKATVPWSIKYRLLYEVIEGVIYLHSHNVLHLDLKAANVLLSQDLHAQICDFGLSKWNKKSVTGSRSQTSVGGTLTHFPPECLEDIHRKPSAQFDVYSYSIYIWEVLTGKQVYQNVHNVPQLMVAVTSGQRPDLSLVPSDPPNSCTHSVIPLMQKCWSADPESRSSVPEIIEVLKPLYEAHKSEAQSAVPALVTCLNDAKKEASMTNVASKDYICSRLGGLARDGEATVTPPTVKLKPAGDTTRRIHSECERLTSTCNNATSPSSTKVRVGEQLVNNQEKSMAWSTSCNRNGVTKNESYVVKLGDHSNSSQAAVENRFKTDTLGTTHVNQINITGGSKVHIGDIHVTQHSQLGNSQVEEEVNERPLPEENNVKVIDPKAVVADGHLHQIAAGVGKCWKTMGRRSLLFEEGDLEALEVDYSALGLVEVITQMLRKWKERYGRKATRKWLATALIFVRRNHLVDILNDPLVKKLPPV